MTLHTTATCARHGEPFSSAGCWECRAEADIADAEAAETERVAAFKMARDEALEAGAWAGEECGACHQAFASLDEVFSHPCAALSALARPDAAWTAPNRPQGNGQGRRAASARPAMANKYAGFCAVCAGRVAEGCGIAIKVASGRWEVRHGDNPNSCPLPAGHTPASAPVAAAAPSARRNRYAGPCAACRGQVAAEAGLLSKVEGRWEIRHDGPCPEAAPAPAAGGYEPAKGDVHLLDGDHYRVHFGQHSGRPYTVRLVVTRLAVWDGDVLVAAGEVETERAPGMLRRLSASTLLTAEQASAWGRLAAHCCFCGRDLDTPESTKAGYGPTCAEKRGLPWG